MSDERCTAEIHHGPGHQSVSTCERTGEHQVHAIFERWAADTKLWVDEQAVHQRYDSGREGFYVFSGIYDESPLEDDEPPRPLIKPSCPTCHHASVDRQPDNTWLCNHCGATNEAKPDYEREESQ